MRLYSQEFQLSGNKSVESMPNTGFFGETQGIVGQTGENAAGPGSCADAVGGRARSRVVGAMAFEQKAAAAAADSEALEPRLSSSPLAAQKTTIIYEEDAGALSEKERLLAKLAGN
ncbi:hypothetical protein LPJ75_005581 [Coemansia sp. RSA 2598]|nr:hypothetical protein LPJ75_005581 [Coemansia sp. RSA 2598]